MSETVSKDLLSVALTLAREASQKILTFQDKPLQKKHKADSSPVTEADLQSDAIICNGLRKAFPDHGVLSEEGGISGKKDSEFLWVVDPLDGTKAFVKGTAGFCVMVGLLKGGRPHLGVVVDPYEGREYTAIRGEGAYHRYQGATERLHVSERKIFSQMPLVISTGFPEDKLKRVLSKLGSPLLEPINSVGIKVGLLVRRLGDIYLNHHGVHYWDTCAPQLILEESGGVFTKLDGTPLAYPLDGEYRHDLPTLASNGLRHEDIVEAVRGILDGDRE